MDIDKLLGLATPYLEKNDFGIAHTKRVFDTAKQNFPIKPELKELTFTSIILHDIGGSTIKEQYKKGPQIATTILKKIACPDYFIRQVCEIISTHHEHPDNPSEPLEFYMIQTISWSCFPHKNIRITIQEKTLTGTKLWLSYILNKQHN